MPYRANCKAMFLGVFSRFCTPGDDGLCTRCGFSAVHPDHYITDAQDAKTTRRERSILNAILGRKGD